MPPRGFPPGGYVADYLTFWAAFALAVGLTVLFFRRTRGKKGLGRLVLGNALVFLCLATTALVAGETYLRYVFDATDSYGVTLTNYAWFARHVNPNSEGYRDVEHVRARKEGVTRVACVGDSFTFGYGVPDSADVWPQRLGTALDAKSPGKFEVRNYGIIGFETGHHADLVDELGAEHQADHVILGYCLNDVDDLLPDGRRFDRAAAPRVPVAPTFSFVADFLWFRMRLRGDPRVRGYFDWVTEAYDDPALFGRQTDRFRRIAERCRTNGMRLDVVVFPFFSAWPHPATREEYRFASCHERVVAAWKRLGVDAIDLRESYRGIAGEELVVNRFDAHPNARAHEIAAKTILERAFGGR